MLNPYSPGFGCFFSSTPPAGVSRPRGVPSCLFPSYGTFVGLRGGLHAVPHHGTPHCSSADLSSSFDRHRKLARSYRTGCAATVRRTPFRSGYLRLLLTTGFCGIRGNLRFGFRLFAVGNLQARRFALRASFFIPPPIFTAILLPLNRHSLLVVGTPVAVSALRLKQIFSDGGTRSLLGPGQSAVGLRR